MEYIPAKKSLGQHWLNDAAALEAMCQAANLQSDDIVLEIGPGPGTLTRLLVDRAKAVMAVEVDSRLAQDLPKRVPASNLTVIQQDILTFDFTGLPPGYKVTANIPYYLTSHLVRIISETPNRPVLAALLVQKEVAQRLAAAPGAMSLLSVTAQFYWQVALGREVAAELFTPPPKVNSQIVILTPHSRELFPQVDASQFFRLVRIGFSQRRKTLQNSLAAGLRIDKTTATSLCRAGAIDPTRRPQTLSLDEWYHLYRAFKKSDFTR